MIIRGTTPYHIFTIPFVSDQINKIYITYLQNGQVILDKNIDDIEINQDLSQIDSSLLHNIKTKFENKEIEEQFSIISLHLTQEDTLKFNFYPAAEKNIAVIQLRILDSSNEAYATNPVYERVFGVLKEDVI